MRRGLLKDLTNTVTQIACGWALHDDLARLSVMASSGQSVTIDLLSGDCPADGMRLEPPLTIATVVVGWLRERLDGAGAPTGLVAGGSLTLHPSVEARTSRLPARRS